MTIPPNPFGLHTVTPYVVVKGVAALIEFLTKVFEAELRGDIHYADGGRIAHAEVQIGDSVIMLGEPGQESDSRPITMYIYVDDCDTRFRMALDAGATVVREPENRPNGDRFGGVRDFAGNQWWIATHVGKK